MRQLRATCSCSKFRPYVVSLRDSSYLIFFVQLSPDFSYPGFLHHIRGKNGFQPNLNFMPYVYDLGKCAITFGFQNFLAV